MAKHVVFYEAIFSGGGTFASFSDFGLIEKIVLYATGNASLSLTPITGRSLVCANIPLAIRQAQSIGQSPSS